MAFGSLTGFFGTNSSGKSSILQFLLMLKQTVESSDRSRVLHLGDDKSYVELGTMYDILFMHEDPSDIDFCFDWNFDFGPSRILFPGSEIKDVMVRRIGFAAVVERRHDFVFLKSFKYSVNEHKNLIGAELRKGRNEEESYFSTFDSTKFIDSASSPVTINKFYGYESPYERTSWKITDLTFQFSHILDSAFSNIYYLGPLREHPSRLYVWAGEQTQSVGNRGERAIAALLSSRNQGPTIDIGEGQPKRTVEEHVAYWLKELGLIYSFKVQPIAPNRKEYEVRIQRTAESASVFLTDVGFGVSQILPVLVLLFYVPEGSTVILEQPEIHLHPAVQAGLADVFIDAIKRRKVQIILESHSEHLLQRLQRRIAETVISQEEIKLYFTSIEEGRSKLTTLELDEYGNIGNWPKGFFGDAFAEAAAKTKAEMKRKMQQQ